MKLYIKILKCTLMFILVAAIITSGFNINKEKTYAAKKTSKYKVIRVIDGDTIVIKKGKKKVKVRLLGIDTPESVHPDHKENIKYGNKAKRFTQKKLNNKKVRLEYDKERKDKYGRTLAYIYIGKKMFNKMLLRAGHAKVKFYPPNTKYLDSFEKAESEAIEADKGIWKNRLDMKYIGTTTTKKFHYRNCRLTKKIKKKNRIYFEIRSNATKKGYKPCMSCLP